MKKKVEELTTQELLEAINKPWAKTSDIMKIRGVGREKARKIKKEIIDQMKADKEFVDSEREVPMEKVVKRFNININYLKKF